VPEIATSPHTFDLGIPGTEISDLWRTLAENLPDNIIAVDRQGYIRWINRTLPEYQRAKVIGSHCSEYVSEDDKRKYAYILEAVFRGETPDPYEVQTLDGRWWLNRAVPVRNGDGEVVASLCFASDISRRKALEESLEQRQRLLERIQDTSPAVVFIFDHVAQRLAYINSRVEELLGYSAAEMMSFVGDIHARIVHPKDAEHVASHIEWLAQQNDDVIGELEYRVQRRDGTHRWVSTRSTIFKRLPDGGLHQTLCSTVDITERRLAAEALAEQRQLLTHIIQTSPAVTFVWDLAADRAVYVNGRAVELLGIDASEFLVPGESLRERWLHPAERETAAGLLVRLVTADDDEVFDVEHRMLHRDGSWRWVHNRAAVFQRDAAGKVTHTIGLLFDVTNRRLAEQALAQSEASLRSVMRYAPDLIAKLDKHGRITYANQFNIRGDGCMLSETHATAWVIPEDTRRLQTALTAVFMERETTRTEIRVHRLDGAERIYDCRFGPIDVNGAVESAIVIARDVTEERRDAEILRMRDAQLAHASRLTVSGGMLAGIAHEVNQPLYAISNFATASLQLLRDDDSPPADTVRQWLSRITEQADRAGGIVRRLREFVGKGRQIRENCDLNTVLRDSLRFVEPMSKASRIRVQAAMSDEPLAASVDRLQVEQVLVNLLQNAVDSMDLCQVADRSLLAGVSREQSEAHISIMDRGVGIPVEDLERAFDPFFTTKPEGLGLGLAISRNIVTAHGGRIWITRNVGAGSTFHVTLPLTGESGHES
jgi:PAS domain S-box-containing protein